MIFKFQFNSLFVQLVGDEIPTLEGKTIMNYDRQRNCDEHSLTCWKQLLHNFELYR